MSDYVIAAAFILAVPLSAMAVIAWMSRKPPKPGASMLRKILRRRMWSYGVPRLCGYHLGSTLRQGQMALLDSPRCEQCAKEANSKNKKRWSFR